MKECKNENQNKKMKKLLLVVVVILLLLLGIKSCVNQPTPYDKWDTTISDGIGDITEEDKSLIKEELNKKVAESQINISMNTAPLFENGSSKGMLEIVNEPSNNYMQIVEIYRDDTNELIYTSSAIPVGKQLASDTLDIDLSKGKYACTAYFNAITEDGEYVGKAGAKINIEVLN